jgi:hypothetical protein
MDLQIFEDHVTTDMSTFFTTFPPIQYIRMYIHTYLYSKLSPRGDPNTRARGYTSLHMHLVVSSSQHTECSKDSLDLFRNILLSMPTQQNADTMARLWFVVIKTIRRGYLEVENATL